MLDEKQKEHVIEKHLNERVFETRKHQHIQISASESSQVRESSQLQKLSLVHEALPEFNLSDVSTSTYLPGIGTLKRPFFISSMTAGHKDSFNLNLRLAQAAERWGLLMGVGSQRKELSNDKAQEEWLKIREACPTVMLAGNIGITQVISTPIESILKLVGPLNAINAKALFVHSNPLQEALQEEGTPQFRNSLSALAKLVELSPVPVIFKEVGSGVSAETAQRLKGIGVKYIDISGAGGTHWGLIEGLRQDSSSIGYRVAQSFREWGHSNVRSLQSVLEVFKGAEDCVFASGGYRNGVDIAKALALGANAVGMAQPFLKSALISSEQLDEFIIQTTQELRIAMFCTGVQNIADFKRKRVWQWLS